MGKGRPFASGVAPRMVHHLLLYISNRNYISRTVVCSWDSRPDVGSVESLACPRLVLVQNDYLLGNRNELLISFVFIYWI